MNPLDLTYHYKLNYRRNFNIVSEQYGVIYYNTQKNANSTIKAQFLDVLGIPKTPNFPKDIHYNYHFPTASQHDIETKYQDFFKFSILRNPWERLVSCYKNKIEQSSKTGKDYILECSPDFYIGMPFEEFVHVVCETPDLEADYHFCSQIYLMIYPDGSFPMNYLCNIENLATHINEIKSKTGIPFSSLANLNSSKKSTYESIYTPELVEKVRLRYQADIEFFKYEFGKTNEVFPFGDVSKEWKTALSNHPLMTVIAKEKKQELLKTAQRVVKHIPPNIKQIIKNEKTLQRELEHIKDSLSWRLSSPLRALASLFMRK